MSPIKVSKGVGSYQILLSVNPLIREEFLSKVQTTTDLATAYKGSEDTTLFSSDLDNFIELKHDYKFKPKADGMGPTISIKTFDPGLSFLNTLYFDFLQDSLGFLADKKSEDAENIKKYYAELEEVQTALEGTLEDIKEHEENPREPTVIDIDWDDLLAGSLEKQTKRKRELEDLIAEMQATHVQPKVYIMYGIGPELAHWAGPIECYLGDVKYTNDGRSETMEYIFATDLLTRQLASPTTIGIPQEDSTFFSNTGIPIQAYRTVPNPYLPLPFDAVSMYELFWESYVDEPINFNQKSFSFHDCIVKLISNYLMKLGIVNNLVVLPNLDSLLSGAINNAIIQEFQKPEVYQASESDEYPGIRFDEYAGLEREAQIAKVVKSLFKGHGAYDQLDLPDYKDREAMDHPLIAKANMNIIISVFNQIGLKVTTISKESSSDLDPAYVNFQTESNINYGSQDLAGDVPGPVIAFHESDVVKCENPFDIIGTEYGTPAQVAGDKILRLDWDHESVWGETENKDWTKPLKMLFDKINSAANAPIMLKHYFISEIAYSAPILHKFGAGTFMGYAMTTGGQAVRAPAFKDKPLFILGDESLIQSLVYGKYYADAASDRSWPAWTWRSTDWLSATQDWPLQQVGLRFGVGFDPYKGQFKSKEGAIQDLADPFWSLIYGDIDFLLHSNDETSRKFITTMWNIRSLANTGTLQGSVANNMGYFTGLARTPDELIDALPDEFGFEGFSEESLENIFRLNLPIFLANTHNANILSYSFDANKFMLSNLLRTINEVYATVAKRYGNITEILDGKRTREEVYEEVMSVLDGLRARHGFTGKGLTLTTGVGRTVDAEEVYDHLATLLYLENVGGIKTRIRKRRSNSVLGFMMLFLENFNSHYIGVIKTLPMFHLSNAADITRDALTIIKSTRKINPNASTHHTAEVNDFFSGPQTILGFSHTITKEKGESEFTLQKNVIMELNNE